MTAYQLISIPGQLHRKVAGWAPRDCNQAAAHQPDIQEYRTLGMCHRVKDVLEASTIQVSCTPLCNLKTPAECNHIAKSRTALMSGVSSDAVVSIFSSLTDI